MISQFLMTEYFLFIFRLLLFSHSILPAIKSPGFRSGRIILIQIPVKTGAGSPGRNAENKSLPTHKKRRTPFCVT